MKYKPSGDDDKYWARKIINGWQESTWQTPQGVVVMEKDLKKTQIRTSAKSQIESEKSVKRTKVNSPTIYRWVENCLVKVP